MKKSILLLLIIFFYFTAIGSSQVCYNPSLNYAGQNNPWAITHSDFNGDGKMDIATANLNSCNSGSITVLLNEGTGTFGTPIHYTTPTCSTYIVSGDFNNDGHSDIVTAHNSAYQISIRLGLGDGNFLPPNNIAVSSTPYFIDVLDFNNDGNLDLISANLSGNSISVFLGNGNGALTFSNTYAVGTTCTSVAHADFNNDGITDVVTGLGSGSPTDNFIAVLLGSGGGNLNPATHYIVGNVPFSVTCGKFNNDNFFDIATITTISGVPTLAVLLGDGSGNFTVSTSNTNLPETANLRSSDVDNDGNIDLLAADYVDARVAISLGNGDGTFDIPVFFSVGNGPRSLTIGDFNGDSKADIATANDWNNGTSVLLSCNSLGVNDYSGVDNAFVTPNPSNGIINIKTNLDKFVITIYNSLGQVTGKYDSKKTIDIESLPQGIYYVVVTSIHKVYNTKVIKVN